MILLKLRNLALVLLTASLFAASGCAHDRHTNAVIGGIIGAGIGYVIASENEHHDRGHGKDHYRSRDRGHRSGHYPPPSRDPYCR